mgnify:CR=1 FL=1
MTKEQKAIYLDALFEQVQEWSEKVKKLREEANVESNTGCTWSMTQLGQAMQQLTVLENAAAELATA